MAARPKVLEFDVSVDRDRTARSSLGGSPIRREDQWAAEHLMLAGLIRCTLASLDHHVRRAGLAAVGLGTAHGVVTRRYDDGLYAFTEIEVRYEVELDPVPEPDAIRQLVARAERGCFVGNSLDPRPRYRWTVNGSEVA
jgi:organic hydroperoxide reductase OsmC/OhrA